jgi:hypothetical protein
MLRVKIARVRVPNRGTKALILIKDRWYLPSWSQYKLLLKATDPEKYEKLTKAGYIPDPAIDPTLQLVRAGNDYYVSQIRQPVAELEIRDMELFRQLVEKICTRPASLALLARLI